MVSSLDHGCTRIPVTGMAVRDWVSTSVLIPAFQAYQVCLELQEGQKFGPDKW